MSALFECKVKHDPSLIPTMTWLKDNGELPDDERYASLAFVLHSVGVKKMEESVSLSCDAGGLSGSWSARTV